MHADGARPRILLLEECATEAKELDDALSELATVQIICDLQDVYPALSILKPHAFVARGSDDGVCIMKIALRPPPLTFRGFLYFRARKHDAAYALAEELGMRHLARLRTDIVAHLRAVMPVVVKACEADRLLRDAEASEVIAQERVALPLATVRDSGEKSAIRAALAASGGNLLRASKTLRADRSRVKRLMDAYEIDAAAFRPNGAQRAGSNGRGNGNPGLRKKAPDL